MKRILSLDLGSASIGWAYVLEADLVNEISKIIKTGVRLVPLTDDESKNFDKGQAITTNADRTQKRSARRNNQRFKFRRNKLLYILKEQNWFDEKCFDITKNELWQLRAKAAVEQISLQELGRVLIHLNQKRGYKSSRKDQPTTEDKKKKEETAYLSRISDNDKMIMERDITIGQYFAEQFGKNTEEGEWHFEVKNKIFSRATYLQEFETIWNTQAKFYSEMTDSLKRQISEDTIFWQRPLKSQKHLISNCYYEKQHKAIHNSHPLFQEFKVWQLLNNLKLTDERNIELVLEVEIKQELFEQLQEKKEMKVSSILSHFKKQEYIEKKAKYDVNFKSIQGNTTRAIFLKVFNDTGVTKERQKELLSFDYSIEGNDFSKQNFLQLWHLIYIAEDSEKLKKKLIEKWDFTEEQAKALTKIKFASKHGSLSAKAIRKLMPHLANGERYDEAVMLAGYEKHSDYETLEERESKDLKKHLQLLEKNSLRNPVVEKVLNQMVNLLNSIFDDHELGKPDEIRIEMARELQMTAKGREDMTKAINKADKRHKEIVELLKKDCGLTRPTRNDIIKYKLWEESEGKSIYTGKGIELNKIYHTKEYDIEHIIPKSRLFDDSFSNKTLSEARLNSDKSNQTAYDYFETKGEKTFEEFVARVNDLFKRKKISKTKRNKLLMAAKDIPEDFIERQKGESAYIAKHAAKMLKDVVRKVSFTTGAITNYLRNEWGIAEMLMKLNIDKYREVEGTETITTKHNQEKERIKGWTKREDHRHHAVDALIVAFTKQKYVKQLNDLNSLVGNIKENTRYIPMPYNGFIEDAKQSISSILISRKAKNKVVTRNVNKIKQGGKKVFKQNTLTPRGALHEDTLYNKVYILNKEPVKLNKKFGTEKAALIKNKNIRQQVIALLEKFDNNPTTAFAAKNLKKHPIIYKSKELKEVICYEEKFVSRKPVSPDLNIENVVDERLKKILQERFDEYSNNKKDLKPKEVKAIMKKAFSNLEEKPIWLNKDKGIIIKKVRVYCREKNLIPLYNQQSTPYVISGENHHLRILENEKGKRYGQKAPFFDVVHRKLQGLDIIEQPTNGDKLICNLQKNDYWVFDIDPEDIDLYNKDNYSLISENLYRVQSISANDDGGIDITFRHHLEPTDKNKHKFATRRISSIKNLKGSKVQINRMGEIVGVERVF